MHARKDLKINADRFTGFAGLYDKARPQTPKKIIEIITRYLGSQLSLVVDLGCGTGLSTMAWKEISPNVIGVDPSNDMLKIAKEKLDGIHNISFVNAYSDDTGLEDVRADVVTCSQSFHWMNPQTTLREVTRLLRPGGIFAAYDCDWPPVCHWEAEQSYNQLVEKVHQIEASTPELKQQYKSWPKDKHLENIQKSEYFRYAREILFSNTETCDAERFIALALSQGGLQAILKAGIDEIKPSIEAFENKIRSLFGQTNFTMDFSYRMRLGVK